MNFDDLKSQLESLEPICAPQQSDEFTAAEAAEVWGITPRAAQIRLSAAVIKRQVDKRSGIGPNNRRVNFYRFVGPGRDIPGTKKKHD